MPLSRDGTVTYLHNALHFHIFLHICSKGLELGACRPVFVGTEFDTGAVKNVMILSVPEGHDKPLKYPLIFTVCDALIINKIDVLPYFDFDMEKVVEYAHMRNPRLEIFPISAKTGEGVEAWCQWLKKQTDDWNHLL